MKEEYVTYEQAVKLKELGFDWKVEHSYTDVIKESAREEWDEEECQWSTVYDINSYPKPRLDQAQKWLREEKKIHIEPKFQYGRLFNVRIQSETLRLYKVLNSGFETYELALSGGIDKALELLTDKLNDK